MSQPQATPRKKPRRKRPSAAERHRKVFFARLGDLRRAEAADRAGAGDQPREAGSTADEAAVEEAATPAPEPAGDVEPAPPEAATGAPAVAEPAGAAEPAPEAEPAGAAEPAAEAERPPTADSHSRPAGPPRARPPRLEVAIARVGGPEIVRAALAPKQDEHGKPMKWAAVCCAQAQGLKPGDPAFNGWVRLAATPVRAIKGQVVEESPPGRRGGPRREGSGRGGDRPRRAERDGAAAGGGAARGGGRGGGREGGRRRPREDRVKPEELAAHGQGGTVGPSVRILAAGDSDKREREERRKAEREAKRKAERERLSRFGY